MKKQKVKKSKDAMSDLAHIESDLLIYAINQLKAGWPNLYEKFSITLQYIIDEKSKQLPQL